MHSTSSGWRLVAIAPIVLVPVLALRALVGDDIAPSQRIDAVAAIRPAPPPLAAPDSSGSAQRAVRQHSATTPTGRTSTVSPAHRARISLDAARHYESAVDKRAAFDALRDSASAESFFFAAEILRDCLEISDHGLTAVVERFVSNLPLHSTDTGDRIASFRQLVEPCNGFDGRSVSTAEIELLQLAGVQRGDARAIAHRLSALGADRALDLPRVARALLELADPYVIAGVSRFLAELYPQGAVIDGTTLDISDNAPVAMAWTLVACDYGAACGASNTEVLRACAHGGVCGIESLDELHLVLAEPDAYRRGQYYRDRILLALERKDYASLGLGESSAPDVPSHGSN